jgi:hypothetical protein
MTLWQRLRLRCELGQQLCAETQWDQFQLTCSCLGNRTEAFQYLANRWHMMPESMHDRS